MAERARTFWSPRLLNEGPTESSQRVGLKQPFARRASGESILSDGLMGADARRG